MATDATETTTTLQALAASIATADGAKALITQPAKQTPMEKAHNGSGGKYFTRTTGNVKRASRASLSYHGVMLEVDYFPSGFCEEAYVEKVLTVEANGADIKVLLSEEQVDEIARRIEQSWEEVGV